jgi:hypothetical protein
MVKITDYKMRVNQDGKTFFILILQAGLEIVRSASGNSYATVKQASMPTTFDEATCKSLIGSELSGKIDKVPCEPYQYTIPATGEVVMLSHRYEYQEEATINDFTKIYNHSTNGLKV